MEWVKIDKKELKIKSKKVKKYKNKAWLYNKYINSCESIPEIAKECECGITTIRVQLKKFGIINSSKKLKCEICEKYLKKDKRKYPVNTYMYTHINIEQKPREHYFCSKECKLEYIFNIKTINLKL